MKKIFSISLFLLSSVSVAMIPSPADMMGVMRNVMQPVFDINTLKQQESELSQLIKKYQPDFEREKRIVNQIEDSVVEGDVEWLSLVQKDKKKVFAIYTESEKEKTKGGVIILHSRGYHANWGTVVKPLRVGLAEQGWDTLSVQLPVLNKEAKYYDYAPILSYANPRIKAAIKFYKEKDIKKIVLIAHACGAHMAQNYFQQYGTDEFSAFIGVGMGATDYKQKSLAPIILTILDKDLPILDIVAEYDFTGVLRFANIRRQAFKQMKNTKNAQIVIPNTDHYYKDEKGTKAMLASVTHWLDNAIYNK